MIERLFRGKDRTGILNKDWLYGMLDSLDKDYPRIIYKDRYGNRIIADVDKESVGQFTGLTDKNIKDIFEGDILTGLFLHSKFNDISLQYFCPLTARKFRHLVYKFSGFPFRDKSCSLNGIH